MLYLDRETGDWTFTAGREGIRLFEEVLAECAKDFKVTPKMTVLEFIKKHER